MRIAIIGTRGIPDHYGGFEQCAEYLAAALVKKGYEVVVYNAHNHPYHEKTWNSVDIRRCYDPTHQLGSVGRFLYAYNCIKDLRKTKFDIILQLAHASSSVWGWFLPHHTVVTTYISKPVYTNSIAAVLYNPVLRFAEKVTVKYSNFLITDSAEAQEYLNHKYGRESSLIPYGTRVFEQHDPGLLTEFKVEINQYDLLVSKITPENNIETILDGVVKANTDRAFLVIGNTDNDYGTYLIAKFNHFKNIIFCGDIDNRNKLNNLRYYANLYFYSHTTGGNNAALLEAMASNSLICSNDNQFNRAMLGNDALYFLTVADVANHLTTASKSEAYYEQLITNNKHKVIHFYSCKTMIKAYTDHFEAIVPRRVRIYHPRVSKPRVSLLFKNS
jgi:glycosyltransferase involved in cell wall biosynthesis